METNLISNFFKKKEALTEESVIDNTPRKPGLYIDAELARKAAVDNCRATLNTILSVILRVANEGRTEVGFDFRYIGEENTEELSKRGFMVESTGDRVIIKW